MTQARRAFGCIGGLAAAIWLLWGTSRLMLERRVEVLQGTTVQYYVTPETFESPRLRSLEVDADGFIVQGTDALVRLKRRKPAWDSQLDPQLVTEGLEDYDAFTVDAGGVIFVTRSKVLYQVAGSGLEVVATLPQALRAAPSREPHLLYLFGASDVFLAGDVKGSARRIAAFDEMPESISALCEGTDGYYVAVGKVISRYSAGASGACSSCRRTTNRRSSHSAVPAVPISFSSRRRTRSTHCSERRPSR